MNIDQILEYSVTIDVTLICLFVLKETRNCEPIPVISVQRNKAEKHQQITGLIFLMRMFCEPNEHEHGTKVIFQP